MAAIKPRDGAGTPAGKDDAVLGSFPEDLVEADFLPSSDGVERIAAGDEEHVRGHDVRAQFLEGSSELGPSDVDVDDLATFLFELTGLFLAGGEGVVGSGADVRDLDGFVVVFAVAEFADFEGLADDDVGDAFFAEGG